MSDIYTLFDGLAYSTCGYFASCVVLYAKPLNKRFIIPLQKGVILIQFYLVRVFLKKMHHLSFRALANDVNSTEGQRNYIMFFI